LTTVVSLVYNVPRRLTEALESDNDRRFAGPADRDLRGVTFGGFVVLAVEAGIVPWCTTGGLS
jgi:hypothetical protein